MKTMDPLPSEPFPTTLAGLFQNTPLVDKSETLQKQALVTLKQQLITDGFYKGKADDTVDPALEQSLKDWQTSKALGVTGRLDTTSWGATTLGKVDVAELDKMLGMQVAEATAVVKKPTKNIRRPATKKEPEDNRNVATKAVDGAKKGFNWMKNKITGKETPPETSKKKK